MKPFNWAGNLQYSTDRIFTPESPEAVGALVRQHPKLKALGSRHSFNAIADSSEAFVSLERLNHIEINSDTDSDSSRPTVTVGGGVRYGELGNVLQAQGFALPNLASLPHISVAGACATGTHGSGDKNGGLATAVSALEMVTADGEILTLTRNHDRERFDASVVGLGALGIVTRLTLDLLPTYQIAQTVYENLPFAELEADFDAVFSSAYSVSLFTDWRADRFTQMWRKSRVSEGEDFVAEPILFGATLATHPLHPIGGVSAEHCTPQGGVPGAWHDRLPHFRYEFTPSNGEELQTEYLVPRAHALAALRAVGRLSDKIAPLLFVSEIRTVAEDTLWLSPAYRQPSVAIHFTWRPDWSAVKALLPEIEAALAPFSARPHWGKLFTMSPDTLPPLYPKWSEFVAWRRDLDPQGKFRNAFLEGLFR